MTTATTGVRQEPLATNALAGKVAVVTGASSGIGLSIAQELGRCGADVVVNYHRNAEQANAVVSDLEKQGRRAFAYGANVADSSEVNAMFEALDRRLGQIDILVNNSGIEKLTPFVDISKHDWDTTLAVNLTGAFLCAQQAARRMIAAGKGGRIINISSVHEDLAFPGYAPYAASKGGLMMLTRTIALELAPHGITVVNVGPGAVATPINERTLNDPELSAALNKAIPIGRVAQPEEVARLVAFLASDAGAYLTATTVFIDGGLMRAATNL